MQDRIWKLATLTIAPSWSRFTSWPILTRCVYQNVITRSCCDSSHQLLPSSNLIICIIISSEKNNVSVMFNSNFQCFNHLIVKSSLTVDCNKQISCKILVMFGLIYGWILLLVMDIISLLTIIYIVLTKGRLQNKKCIFHDIVLKGRGSKDQNQISDKIWNLDKVSRGVGEKISCYIFINQTFCCNMCYKVQYSIDFDDVRSETF